jgi:nicotinamide phosphoribosyltransferase
MNPLFWEDFYKIGHIDQYPADTEQIWSNWTPRSSHVKLAKGVVFFGLQYFIKEILQHEWDKHFFSMPIGYLLSEYRDVISATLGVKNPRTDHIERLHELGYLPLDIYALPEGSFVQLRVPCLVITNTHPEFFWLPNFFETILSNILWKPCTSATTAQSYRKIFVKYAREAGEDDLSFVDWQGHDFSMRGMSGREDSMLSGMGHLLSFSGTDTIPAIVAAHKYYSAPYSVGGSVPATEHSVMCADGQEGELETFRRLIEDVYPSGVVSIVSDTWDLWKVLTEYVPALREKILARDGKLVIRPDSGDPVNIMCGDHAAPPGSPQSKGVLQLLQDALQYTWRIGELTKIRKAGAIYGDSITLERCEEILRRTVRELKMSPYNVVLGIGSFTYEYVTRDTYGFAMKATAVRRDGMIYDIFKKPVTDNGEKNSLKGIPVVYRHFNREYYVCDGSTPQQLDHCEFRKVYSNGKLLIDEKFQTIRERVRRDSDN